MITIDTAISIHKIAFDEFGGSDGIRDRSLLESALARPYQTFDGIDLYPTTYIKAAAILESILINHPFIDGNKRTAYLLMNVILEESNITIHGSQEEMYKFVIHFITDRPSLEAIATWIEQKSSIHE